MIARLDDVDLKLRIEQAQAQLDQAKAALGLAEEKIGIKARQPLDPNKVPEVVNARVALLAMRKTARKRRARSAAQRRAGGDAHHYAGP